MDQGETGSVALHNHVHVPDREALAAAADLIEKFGAFAGSEAASRAETSRGHGNAVHFSRWRLIERMIFMLTDDSVAGTVH